MLIPLIAAATPKPKENPLIFTVDPNLQKPLIIYGPYEPKRFAPKVNKPIPRKILSKKENKQPVKTADSARVYGQGEIQSLIVEYSAKYGIAAGTPLCIAKLESGFNPNSKNKSSSASGVFQWIKSSWLSQPEGKQGISVFDAEANIRAAVRYMSEKKSTKPWVVNSKCPPVTSLQ